jgi:O-methyltransferase involved in polyketide biosynthesis
MTQRAQEFNDRWAKVGCDVNLSGLFYDGDRANVAAYLTERGWEVATRMRRDLFGDYGLEFHDDEEMAQFRNITAVTATLK